MEDLKPGMVLEGIVTNVTAFGAFVDIGVHNDGLVHVSQLSEQFVKEPSEIVKVGQKLKVRVLEIDHARKRIALSARPPQPKREREPQRDGTGATTSRAAIGPAESQPRAAFAAATAQPQGPQQAAGRPPRRASRR